MSRIIAGLAGSIRLAPAAAGTRPSSDRLKESLFSQLENLGAIEDARVLDLFAGSGALGLEALSRGAASLTGVEKNRPALEVCLRNAASVGSALNTAGKRPPIEFKLGDAFSYAGSTTKEFDLVLLDPPYDFDVEKVESLLKLLVGVISKEGLIALEQSAKMQIDTPDGLALVSNKNYGDSAIWLFTGKV